MNGDLLVDVPMSKAVVRVRWRITWMATAGLRGAWSAGFCSVSAGTVTVDSNIAETKSPEPRRGRMISVR